MPALVDRAAGGRMRRAVLVLAGGTALAQLVVLAAYPIISRLYTPEEFGTAAGLLAVLAILLPAACLTYDHAIPLPDDQRSVMNLIVLASLVTVVFSVGLAVVFLIAGDRLVDAVADGHLASSLPLIVIALLFGGLALALTGWAIRNREFGAISASRVTHSLGLVVTQVGAGFAGMAGGGLVLGEPVGRFLGFLRLSLRLRSSHAGESPGVTPAGVRAVAFRYRRFPLVGTWPNLMQGFVLEAPLLLLIGFYGVGVGGHFAFGQRLIAAPVALIVMAVSQVFISEAAEHLRRDPASLRRLFTASLTKLLRSGIVLLPFLSISGIVLVPLIFGDPWQDAGFYLAILSPLYAAQVLTSPFGGVLDVLERQDLLLVREFIRAALLIGSVVLAWSLGWSALWAVVAVSIAGTLAYAAYGAISWYAVKRA